MKLDRSENSKGLGKYALINLRVLAKYEDHPYRDGIVDAMSLLRALGIMTWGEVGTPDEFFAIKLKDKHAQRALNAYAVSIEVEDPEFAQEVANLAKRSGPNHPLCKAPD